MTVAGASTLPILRVLLRVLVLLFTDTPDLDAWLDRTSSDGPRPAHRHSHVPRRPQRNCAHVPLARLHATLVDERRSMAGRCECPVITHGLGPTRPPSRAASSASSTGIQLSKAQVAQLGSGARGPGPRRPDPATGATGTAASATHPESGLAARRSRSGGKGGPVTQVAWLQRPPAQPRFLAGMLGL